MQNTSEINWLLEVLKIVSPIFSALILGFWLNSRNEKIKADLQKQFYKSQVETEEKKLHLAKMEELCHQISSLQNECFDFLMKVREYSHLPYSTDLKKELKQAFVITLGRIDTLGSFYTQNFDESFHPLFNEFTLFETLGNSLFIKAKGNGLSKEDGTELFESYRKALYSTKEVKAIVLRQTKQFRQLNPNSSEMASLSANLDNQ